MIAWLIAATAAAVVVLLVTQRARPASGRIPKMVASTGFVAIAIAAGGFDSTVGLLIIGGLVLSWGGDLALTYQDRRSFVAGLGLFLLAHVAYVGAFVVSGLSVVWTGLAAVVALVAAVLVARLLLPLVDADLRRPVVAYMGVISVMVATAIGAGFGVDDPRLALGAVAFYLSDLSVARDRFVAPGFINRLWGLPLYYGGQVLLALAAGT